MPLNRKCYSKSILKLSVLISAALLAGCTSQTDGKPSGQNSVSNSPLMTDFGQPSPQANKTPLNMAKIRQYKLYIAPVIGVSQEAMTPLSLRFDTISKDQAIPLAGSEAKAADYMLKGYFSNLAENNQTTVLYVWDVIDKQGNRVHRLQGKETVTGQSVTAPVMYKIADDTMNEYFRWVSANGQ